MKHNKKIKKANYILLTSLLIFFLLIIIFNYFNKKINPKLYDISKTYLNKHIYNEISGSVNRNMMKTSIDNILIMHQNKDGEILYIDYDLDKSYELLDYVTNTIKTKINNLSYPCGGIILKLPIMMQSDNVFLNNIGPKVSIKINFINSIIANIYTKITNYGLNNALVEAYIKISIEGKIITPVKNGSEKIEYNVLIASKVINGRVPSLYGNNITSSSSLFDIPIE